MKQYLIGGLIGAVLIFVVLKLISKKPKSDSKIFDDLLELAKTQESKDLFKTEQFNKVLETQEFTKLATDLGVETIANFVTI